jgi:hypothetical protein
VREQRQLLPAQGRYPAQPPVVRQGRPARVESGPSRAQEVTQLVPALAHVRENLAAQDIELSPEDIRSISGLAPEGPAAEV